MDEGDLHTHLHLAKVWQRRGCPLIVPAAGQDQRRVVFGALDYASGEVRWQIEPQKGGEGFATFLAQIADHWPPDQMVLVTDKVSYHRSRMVRDWWAAQDGRITPLWLPVYSPNLNLIERVWRYLKQKLACHRFWANVEEFQEAAGTLLDRREAHFHEDDAPGIYLPKAFCNAL